MLAGVVQKIFRLDVEKNKSGNLSRYMVPVVALVSLYFIFNGNDTLVAIMLLGVNIIAQFFPALIFSFAKESNYYCGCFSGIMVGVIILAVTYVYHISIADIFPFITNGFEYMNIGVVAFAMNFIVTFFISYLTRSYYKEVTI